jgi:hypothetical protein
MIIYRHEKTWAFYALIKKTMYQGMLAYHTDMPEDGQSTGRNM